MLKTNNCIDISKSKINFLGDYAYKMCFKSSEINFNDSLYNTHCIYTLKTYIVVIDGFKNEV